MKCSPGYSSYLAGFMTALVLTVLGFMLASIAFGKSLQPLGFIPALFPNGVDAIKDMPRWVIQSGIFSLAFLQILVHLRYFLHLDFSARQRMTVQAIFFALLIMFILVCGTLWIMLDLERQMTPV